MSKLPTDKQKAKLADLMEQLDWFYGVSNQERHLYYAKEPCTDSPDCTADITVDEPYQRITLTIYPSFWEHSERQQRLFIVHEYTHYLVQPLQRIAKNLQAGRLHTKEDISDAVEKVTSSVSIMVNDLLNGRRQYMIKAYTNYLTAKKKTNATNTTKTKKRARTKARV